MKLSLDLRVGDWVEIRSKEEILKTLDTDGQLTELPFMPEMFQYCGKRFKVFKRAHKTCDTATLTGGRRMTAAVHLDGLRCDGAAHGGCQAGCLIFWKEAWLKPVSETAKSKEPSLSEFPTGPQAADTTGCTEADVLAGTRARDGQNSDEPRYVCQATQLPSATTPLPWWKISQYLEDYTSGNVTLRTLFRGLVYATYYRLSEAGLGLGRIMRWLYDRLYPLWGGVAFPRRVGTIPAGRPTPACTLNLQPGELVQVKSHQDILATLDTRSRNRGLLFDAEMVPYCGGTYRVLGQVRKIIDEKTGKLVNFKNANIVLQGVVCQARYSDCRFCPMFCPRAIYSYWREIWLERIPESAKRELPDASDLAASLPIGRQDEEAALTGANLK
jgi:hypothetical protein